ncbi:MAG: CDP-alcohol phosphatidyltransferase family protein, partial [Patescibacteria group bacterium]|nr:CDP-alcohol phosphatidyltransferase family protein [Patescibacteria group bacterium]
MSKIAGLLNKISGGKITPNGITWFGFFMHIPIAYFIATGNLIIAGVGLIIFGLFDTLDGELARL